MSESAPEEINLDRHLIAIHIEDVTNRRLVEGLAVQLNLESLLIDDEDLRDAELVRHIALIVADGAWMSSLLSSVVNFFANLVSKIVDWIKKAVVWVEGAAKTIADWASGAANAVGHFFSSLF